MPKLLVPEHIAELPPVHQLPAGGAVIKMIHLPRQIGRGYAERVQFGSIRSGFAALLVHSCGTPGRLHPFPYPIALSREGTWQTARAIPGTGSHACLG